MNNSRKEDLENFLTFHNWNDATVKNIDGDASFRSYKRLERKGEIKSLDSLQLNNSEDDNNKIEPFVAPIIEPAILMDAPPPQEDVKPFIKTANFLIKSGLKAPTIYAENIDKGFLILEDFGDSRISRMVENTDVSSDSSLESEKQIYKTAIDVLIYIHKTCKAKSHFEEYSKEKLLTEVELLKDWYLPHICTNKISDSEQNRFMEIWSDLIDKLSIKKDNYVLVLRDYHADNLMWLNTGSKTSIDKIGLLDFQDALFGHPAYDLMSLLEDVRRNVLNSDEDWSLCNELIDYYLSEINYLDHTEFLNDYSILAAQRNCKILGIFARLCIRDNKNSYKKFFPRVIKCLKHDLENDQLSELKNWFELNIFTNTES